MRELVYCPVCSKKKWSDVIILEVGTKENTIEVMCPKCKNRIRKIVGKPN